MHNLIISALLGLVAGAIGGYLAGYSKGKKVGHAAAEAELGSAKAYIENYATAKPVAAPRESFDIPTTNGAVGVNQFTNDGVHVERQPERTKYFACYGNTAPECYTAPTDEDENDEKVQEAMAYKAYVNEQTTAPDGEGPIWLMPNGIDDFGQLGDRSPEVYLKYWVDNGVLTNDEDEVIDNPQRHVGPFLGLFHRDHVEEEPIFLRNSLLGCDIRVDKILAGYDGDDMHYEGGF